MKQLAILFFLAGGLQGYGQHGHAGGGGHGGHGNHRAGYVFIASGFSSSDIDYRKHPGYIELSNGERITGIFKYANWEFPTYNLKYYIGNNQYVARFKSRNIRSVVLAGSDSCLSNRDSTYFIVYKKLFYRQLSFNPNLEVYDQLFDVNEARDAICDDDLLVKWNNQYLEFNSPVKFIRWLRKNTSGIVNSTGDIPVEQIIRELNGLSS